MAGLSDFYRADLAAEVTERTWAALCEETSAVHGLLPRRTASWPDLHTLCCIRPPGRPARPATWRTCSSPSHGAVGTWLSA